MVNLMLSVTAERLAMRGLVERQVLDRDSDESLLGTFAQILMAACLDPGDSRSLEDLLAELVAEQTTFAAPQPPSRL